MYFALTFALTFFGERAAARYYFFLSKAGDGDFGLKDQRYRNAFRWVRPVRTSLAALLAVAVEAANRVSARDGIFAPLIVGLLLFWIVAVFLDIRAANKSAE